MLFCGLDWMWLALLARERQEYIYQLLQNTGAVTTAELMDRLNISIETVRRDLLALEQAQRLQRVHGGAVTAGGMKPFPSLSHRTQENEEAKQELAVIAAGKVCDGDIIGVDSGSTALLFAEALKKNLSSLTVVTYSLDVFECLCRFKNFQVILCGGYFCAEENAFYGAMALETLEKLHMQKVFVCPSALSLKNGIGDYQKELYPLQKQLLVSGDEVYVLADNSKFEKSALFQLDAMKPHYTYVTDRGLSPELRRLYRENQIKILCERGDAQ